MKKIVSLLLAGILLSLTACTATPAETSATTAPQDQSGEPEDSHLLFNQDYALNFDTYLTIPMLSELKLSQTDLNANWEAMAAQITSTYATYSDAPEGYEAANGDKVSIHYKGYAANPDDKISAATLLNMQNIQNSDGSAIDPTDLVLGSNSMIGAYESADHPEKNNAGFEEQLIGMKAGETRTITVTFPDNYGNSDELRGMVTHFDVTVYSIKMGSTPQLTDDLVATYTQNTYITKADESLRALGYTEHSFAHVGKVSCNAAYILETLGYDERTVELSRGTR